MQDDAGAADTGGAGVEGFQLPENLRLTHDHRVEARRHPEEMPDGLRAAMQIEARVEIVGAGMCGTEEATQLIDGAIGLLR